MTESPAAGPEDESRGVAPAYMALGGSGCSNDLRFLFAYAAFVLYSSYWLGCG